MVKLFIILSLLLVIGCGGKNSESTSVPSKADALRTVAIGTDPNLPLQITTWRSVPRVGVISAKADDPRIAQVRAAVEFWNSQLEGLDSGLRLGPVQHVMQQTPDSLLVKISQAIGNIAGPGGYRLTAGEYDELSRGLDNADLVVMLSDGNFVSFSSGVLAVSGRSRSLVAIRGVVPPLAQPNIMPNLIAHEIGHSLGLLHNADVSKLMCGRPAECRPDAFASEEPRYFPLTDQDKARLLQLYPATWRPVP
ncbi:MAG TPA: hypothetical protein VJB57_00160 [Dehalococcoidia bacterium]|nr:hypothetical protein [Dehalococcoidia bacterium]